VRADIIEPTCWSSPCWSAPPEDLPRPDLPLVVGLDGGFVHSADQRSRRDGWFEVIAGEAVPAEGKAAALASCRPTTPSPNGGCTGYCDPRAWP
jgi:hypothetical protein